jgi:Amt family ammonium transporter
MTIVSGSLTERTFLDAYIIYSLLMTGFIYPIQAGWAWGDGWLSRLGYHDFAGSGIVHMCGGVGGLTGCYILGARLGTFNKTLPELLRKRKVKPESTVEKPKN